MLSLAATLLVMSASAAPGALELPATTWVLDNGLRVVHHADPTAPLVAVVVRVAVGGRDEERRGAGLAHVLEHVMYVGSRNAPDGAYDALLAEMGGDNNAWTDHDATSFHAVVPAGGLDRLLWLEADRLARLADGVSPEQLGVQLDVVSAEAAIALEGPHARDLSAVLAAVFGPEHPYAMPVLGDPAVREELALADVLDFHARHYQPGRVTLAVAGAVSRAEAERLVTRHLGDWGGEAPPRRAMSPAVGPVAPVGGAPVSGHAFVGPVDQPTLYLAWPTVPRGHADEAALLLLSRILSEGRSSPLSQALRGGRRRGAGDAWTWTGDLGGLFVVQVAGSKRLADLVRPATQAVGSLQGAGVTRAAVARQQRSLLARRVRASETLLERAEALALCAAREGRADCPQRELDALLALTVEDLRAAAARWLPPEGATPVSVAPVGSEHLAVPGSSPLVLP